MIIEGVRDNGRNKLIFINHHGISGGIGDGGASPSKENIMVNVESSEFPKSSDMLNSSGQSRILHLSSGPIIPVEWVYIGGDDNGVCDQPCVTSLNWNELRSGIEELEDGVQRYLPSEFVDNNNIGVSSESIEPKRGSGPSGGSGPTIRG